MERKPVTLTCEYCHQTIYEDEKYFREDEINPDCHQSCYEKKRQEEAAAHKAEIARIKAKESRGEELTNDEIYVIVTYEQAKALEEAMFNMRDSFLGPGISVKYTDKGMIPIISSSEAQLMKPTTMYSGVSFIDPDKEREKRKDNKKGDLKG